MHIGRVERNKMLRRIISAFLFLAITNISSSLAQDSSSPDLLNFVQEHLDNNSHDKLTGKLDSIYDIFRTNSEWPNIYALNRKLFFHAYKLDSYNWCYPNLLNQTQYVVKHIENDTLKARALHLLAFVEDQLGYTSASKNHYLKCQKWFENLDLKDDLARVLGNIGIIDTKLGDYSSAIFHLKKCISIFEAIDEKSLLPGNYKNLGRAYFYNQEYAQAEIQFYKSHELQADSSFLMQQLIQIYLKEEKLDSTRILFEEFKKLYPKEGLINELSADIHLGENKPKAALADYHLAKANYSTQEDPREIGKFYYKIARTHLIAMNYDSSLYYFNKCLQLFSKDQIDVYHLDQISLSPNLFKEKWFYTILGDLSRVYDEMSIENINFRSNAMHCMDISLDALDYKRSFLSHWIDVYFLNKEAKPIYENVISKHLDWYTQTGDFMHLENAFSASQRYNSFLLRREIHSRIILESSGISSDLIHDYIAKKNESIMLGQLLVSQYSDSLFSIYRSSQLELEAKISEINEFIPRQSFELGIHSIPSVAQIQQKLSHKKAVLKYFLGDDQCFLFVLTKHNIIPIHLGNSRIIKDRLKIYRDLLIESNSISQTDPKLEIKFTEISHELYNLILAKAVSELSPEVDQLVIIPDGLMASIPIESLLYKPAKGWSSPQNYLIYKYGIQYAYYAQQISNLTVSKNVRKFISFGLEYDQFTLNAMKNTDEDSISLKIIDKFRSEKLSHLQYSDDEAIELAELFGGEAWVNNKATKDNFLFHCKGKDLIHISAHSFIDDSIPQHSSIIFTKRNEKDDNLLQIKDIRKIQLSSDLITLSACNTFVGRNNEGEGLTSLAHAFIQGGSKSVVGSLWTVPDEISRIFMLEFYSNLKKGYSKDQALRHTKINFLSNDNLSSPAYRRPAFWSSWIVFGDTSPIVQAAEQPTSILLILSFSLVLLMMVFWLVIKKYK